MSIFRSNPKQENQKCFRRVGRPCSSLITFLILAILHDNLPSILIASLFLSFLFFIFAF